MSDRKKISIIIATWNAAKTLRNCLDSIVPQLTEDTELLIIDGGSTDETMDIVRSYGDKIAYSVSEPDKGIYDAWNKGIKIAKGQWIAFIGADDELLPNAINIYLKIIQNTHDIDSYDYICAHNEFVDFEGQILRIMGGAPKWQKIRKGMNAAHVASLHNKHNLFENLGGFDINFKICADYEMLLRKNNNLKYIMLDAHIAKMKVGGMSFSVEALKEVYKARKKHHSVPEIANVLLLVKDVIRFKLSIIKNKIKGVKI